MSVVVPYPGVLISTGSSTYQSVLSALWGSNTSVLYSVPIWNEYSAMFPTAWVEEVRVTYTPHANQTITNWQGSGLAGFFTTSPSLVPAAPTTNLISFRQECSTAKAFYPGRQYRAVFSTRGHMTMRTPMTTLYTGTPAAYSPSWGYGFEGNPSTAGTILGVILFEFLVHFYHS